MSTYPEGRNVRFHDAPRQHVLPPNAQRTHVRFDDAVEREHAVFTQDPPARGRWTEEPPSPRLRTRPLPGTPELGGLRLTERASPNHSPTPANSPETRTASLTTTPSARMQADSSPSPSPPSSPEPQADVSLFLAGPGLQWNVRGPDLDATLRTTYALDRCPAFTSKRKSCTLRFVVDEANEWTVDISPRPDASPLTVWDVLYAIRRSLFALVEESALIPGDPRYAGAIEERPRRLYGQEDARANVFRNVDFYPAASQSYFHGLVEDTSGKGVAQFVVLMGPLP
ncbi:hypothetical protein C8T65DRAFT_97389 [Cerioporus squamosus]|nr:hypothetical protein C8T65DRAFT_97389 [Cerioporus squamosus]